MEKQDTNENNIKDVNIPIVNDEKQDTNENNIKVDDILEIENKYDYFITEINELNKVKNKENEIEEKQRQFLKNCVLDIQNIGIKKDEFIENLLFIIRKQEVKQRVKNSKNKNTIKAEKRNYQFKKHTIDCLDKFFKMTENEREHTREQEHYKIRKIYNEKLNNL